MRIWYAVQISNKHSNRQELTWELVYDVNGMLYKATLKNTSGLVKIHIITPGTVLW